MGKSNGWGRLLADSAGRRDALARPLPPGRGAPTGWACPAPWVRGSRRGDRATRATQAAGAMLLMLAGLPLARNSGLAADAAYGEYLAAECVTCHRADVTTTAIPPLRFLSYEHLVAALKEYRNGTRANAVMQSVARSLGDREIEALAAYFSGRS